MRLRAIFQRVGKLKKFECLSDLNLLNCIIIALRELELPYSIKEVYSAFKLVDKNDYHKGQKKMVLKSLTNGSKNKSVFQNRQVFGAVCARKKKLTNQLINS
jgi:hypothetical protein